MKGINMKNIQWYIGSAFLGTVLVFGFGSLSVISADEYEKGEHHEKSEHEGREHHNKGNTKQVMIKPNKLYKEECGSCHIAYPAGLLPKKSWDKIMNNLENHFDENAELAKEDKLEIQKYLADNALSKHRLNNLSKMLRNFPKKQTPIRITKLPYFIRKHDEVPARMVSKNPEVKSFSQCDKCHSGAEKGNFDEHGVKIPGFGAWED